LTGRHCFISWEVPVGASSPDEYAWKSGTSGAKALASRQPMRHG
jgi:hypothetical protein